MSKHFLLLALWFLSEMAFGQNSEPRQDVRVRGGTDNTPIGNLTDSLKVTAIQSGAWSNTCLQGTSPWVTSATQSGTWTVQQGSPPWSVSQSGTWTAGRTWTLSSGTDSVNVNNISGTVSLPTGAATEVTLAKLPVAQGSTTSGESGPLAQGAATTSSPSYSTGTTNPLSLTTAGALRTDASATTQPISAAALPLPVGASTSALQTSGNSSLSSIDTKTPALGQTTMAGSSPVVIASNQSAVPVSQSGTWTTGRTWTLSNGTDSIAAVQSGTWSVRTQDGAGNALASSTTTPAGTEQALIVRNIPSGTQAISGTVTANQGTSPWVTSRNWTLSNGTDSIAAVQSGSWTVQQGGAPWSVSQSGTWTVQPGNTANTTPWLTTLNQGGNSATVTGANALKVDGSAVTQPVSGTVTANAGSGTFAISAVSLPLPTGASTEATLAKIPVAQGSTTSGESGPLTQGAVTTAAPTYTTGQTDPLSLTTAGALRTDSSSTTQPISGTVTANQGGTWNINNISGTISLPTLASTSTLQSAGNTSLASIATNTNALSLAQASTTSGQVGNLVQGAVTTGAPSYTTGQTDPLSLTTAGALRTDSSGTTQPVSGTVTANQGGAPWSVSQSGSWTTGRTWTLSSGTDSVASVQSGTWTMQPGNTANTTPWLSTINQGGNSASVTASNALKVDGSAVTQPISAAALPLPSGASTEATLAKLTLAQGATTSGESGPLVQGAVTTAAPSYTTALTSPLSLTTAGALRVDGSAVSQTTIYSDIATSQTITALDAGTSSLTGANGQVFYFGTPTVGSAASFSVASYNSVTVQSNIIGAGGTMVVEVSMDGGSFWFRPNVYQISTQSYGNAFTSPFMGIVNLSGMTNLRVRATVSWSGTATILARESLNDRAMTITEALPPGTNTIGNISNISGTVSLPTGASSSALQASGNSSLTTIATNTGALVLSQGSTTSGQTGALTLGAVTTAAPSYSTGQTDPISITTAGALRTDSSAVTQPVSQSTTPWVVAGAAASGASKSGNPVQLGAVFNTTQPTVTTGQAVEGQATARGGLIVATGVDTFTVNSIPLDGAKQSFSASATAVTAAATPTDVFTLTGSGTKTIRITRVELSGTETLSASKNVLLIKRSAANTGGTSATLTAVPYDSANSAATATARSYTANPTGLGATVGAIRSLVFDLPAPGGATGTSSIVWDFGSRPAQAVVLRGAAEVLAINLNGVTSAGNSLSFSIEWSEE